MADQKFKVGDIVQLKSGGPKMTVRAADYSGFGISCQWFAGSKLESGVFDPKSLIPMDEEKTENRKKLN